MLNLATAPADETALYWYKVKVERIVDGDTFVGTIELGYNLNRTGQYFRMAYVNTPERGQEGFQEATDYMIDRIEGKEVMVYSHRDETGRYKRIVAETFIDGENVNRELLEKGFAVIPDYVK